MDILMRSGMLIDIDHMSERATDETLALGRDFPSGWGYPLISGHNGPRGTGGEERHLRADQMEAIRDRGGMLGLGWSHSDAARFRENFGRVREILGDGRVAFGTDMNGAEHQPGPRAGTRVATTWRTGLRVWDYSVDGVANYGMIPEFVQDL
ncbi:MAG: membrane dipeptidase (plasmid) [Candidatus Manganitrophus sp.]|nr:MAG: membrane dipeptidase [Candidatus Manganitrophus sp.]WDT77915.1 MAG: membrane dipeptidase [Candidatus Manganitrophus sp.]